MSDEKYHITARVIHWLMAVGFVLMWICGYVMTSLDDEEPEIESDEGLAIVSDQRSVVESDEASAVQVEASALLNDDEEESALSEFLFDLHISIGVTLLVLLVLRIVIRIMHTPPQLPAAIPRVERIGAHLGHWALYVLPAFIIACGWAETNFGGHTVHWFGIEMPQVFPAAGEDFEEWAELFHMWLAYTMLAIALVHIAAVGKHRWIDRHDVLSRMTFSFRKKIKTS